MLVSFLISSRILLKNAPNDDIFIITVSLKAPTTKAGQTITGVISTTQKGAGFIDDIDPKKDSIYIEPGFLNTALNRDTVEVVTKEKILRGVKQTVGEVVRVVSRGKENYVGIVGSDAQGFYLIADDRKMYVNIRIREEGEQNGKKAEGEKGKKAEKDDKVQITLDLWTDPKASPTGTIIKILGRKGNNDVEMESIVLERGFEVGFPAEVEREAHEAGRLGKIIPPEEIVRRRDMRETLTFTIDPFDAKDFDDAISFKEIGPDAKGQKRYEIGVHIADVSHFVRPGTALDAEAVKRGCSVYLVDRTIPMLPEALSNDVCSLNPHTDKLSFSAIFVMNDRAEVLERWFGRTIMNSAHRFTYETAQAAIDGIAENVVKYSKSIQSADLAEPGMKHRAVLTKLNEIAKLLQKEKFAHGAIEFEQEEIKFRLDGEGKPIGVYVYERLDTHKLVEEYMLLANREVAKFIFDAIKRKGTRDTGAIYRIHDAPDKDKIRDLVTFVKALGYTLPNKDGVVTAHDLNHLLDQVEGTPHESLVRTAAVRSMQKAVYSTANIGHFGLAFEFYTHFTSPIRRYPDLLVHRVLAKHLNNEPFGDRDAMALQKIAESSTAREIDAASAERESKKLKQVEYMSTRVGKTFDGVISGVAKWGIYVEENESKSEGMIRIGALGNDFYDFDEKTYSIVGQRTKKRFTLGDPVTFRVVSADLDRKMLEYELAKGKREGSESIPR